MPESARWKFDIQTEARVSGPERLMTRGFIDGEYQDGEIRGLVLVLGMRNMGKTTEACRLLTICTGGVFFFDTLSKHAHIFPDYKVFSESAPLLAYLRVNRGRRFHVLYQPRGGNLNQHFADACKIAKAIGWMIFCVDEIDKLCSPSYGDTRMPPELYDLVNYGRHYRVSMIATARRPKSVAPGYRDEAEFRVFRLKADTAESIRGDIGDEAAARVVTLDKYYYLRFLPDADPELCGGPR